LDDRPASDSFENRAFIGELDNGVCTEPACPAAGTVGLINQDVTFDGSNDLITVPMVSTTPDYMVSLWLLTSCLNCGVYTLEKSTHTALNQIYLKNGNVCAKTGATEMCTEGNGFANEQWHHVVYANNGSVANLWLDDGIVNTISGGSVLPDSPDGFARLGYASSASQDYLYGQLDDVRVFRYSQDASMVALLKRQAPLALFHLDEETAASGFEDATPSDWMLDCAGACPQTYLPGRLGHSVEFSGTQQLALRQSQLSATTKSFSTEVWVYPTRIIDQPQTLWVLGTGDNSAVRYSLAIAPNSLKLCLLRTAGDSTCPEDSAVGLIQNVWNHVTLTVEQPIPPTPSSVVTEIVRLYINGYQDSVYTGNSGTSADLSGLGRLWIGDKPAAFDWLAGGAFGGRIDEVTLFEDVLNEIDVRDTYRYQMSQAEEFASIDLTIDAEPPTVELISYNPAFPYLNGNNTQLQVDASNPTSAINMVEMRVLYHGAPRQEYHVAPVCLDSTLGTSFCPTFVPDAGDGTYELSFRAVDLVGHQAETQNYPIYVDNAGPQIDCDQQSAGVKAAQMHPYKKHTWLLHLNGSINDESLSDGVAGSGVDTSSVRVTLFSATGETIGLGPQIPTLTPSVLGYDWELDYLMPEKEPTGKLTVLIEGLDKVGNRGQRQFDLLLDATPPRGKLKDDNLPKPDLADLLTPPGQYTRRDNSISDMEVAGAPVTVSNAAIPETAPVTILISGTLSGTISDIPTDDPPYITADGKAAVSGVNKVETAFLPEVDTSYLFNEPYPDGLLAWLPLDQDQVPVDETGEPNPDSNQRLFIDISPYQNAGNCLLPDCPVAGIEGHKMGTMYFSGAEQYINLANQVDLANRSFSVSIWAQRDQADHNDPMLWQGPVSVASKRFLFGVNDQNRFVCGFGGSDLVSPLSYSDTDWHHWGCTFDLASGVRTIYRDSQALASDLAAPLPSMYENLFIGLAPVGAYKGHLDELQIFGRALNASQVREQYTAYNMVYHLAVVENWYADGDLVKDSSGYFHDGRLVSGDPNNKVVAGKVGDFALKFDGDDRLAVPADQASTASYSLNLDRGAFTQAAWIYPAAGSGEGDILSQRDENPEMRYPSILLTSDDRLKVGFGDFYDWHEIETPPGVVTRDAWNFVAATFDGTNYHIYVNGAQVLESDDLAGLTPYASQAFNVGDGFTGELDDLRIFTRALDKLEIQALMGSDWRLANLQGSGAEATWTNTLVGGLEGPYHIGVRGWDVQGHYDTSMLADDQWGGVVDTLAPRIQMVRTPDPVPTGTYTVTYSFSIEDTMLDEETILENMCAGGVTLKREYYNSSWYLAQGLPPNTRIFRVSGECQGDIRATSEVGVYACDLGGNCASATFPPFYDNTVFLPMVATSGAAARLAPPVRPVPPAAPPQGAQPLLGRRLVSAPDSLKPEVTIATQSIGWSQVRNLVHILLKGAVWDNQQVAWVRVRILKDGQQVYATQASLYGRIWNALWAFIPGHAPTGGVYTLEVTASDLAGNLRTVSQPITVDFTP
jgi:hypothetical protein